jgi:hypothetical protein
MVSMTVSPLVKAIYIDLITKACDGDSESLCRVTSIENMINCYKELAKTGF